jgi:shikimate dehydrogenase
MTDWEYEAIAIPPDIVRLSLRELRDHLYVGVNVTVPLKELALPHTRPDERARRIGAVNTVTLSTMESTNTDVSGFMDDLAAHGVAVAGRRVLMLGAGGAARAAVFGLNEAGADLRIVNRSSERYDKLVADLGVTAPRLTAAEALDWGPELVVNATSLGMWPNVNEALWPEDVPFPRGVTAYDMVYRPERTRLMVMAEAAGGQAIGGLGMLARQGAAAFKIWTGKDAPVDVMLDAARTVLRARDAVERT